MILLLSLVGAEVWVLWALLRDPGLASVPTRPSGNVVLVTSTKERQQGSRSGRVQGRNVSSTPPPPHPPTSAPLHRFPTSSPSPTPQPSPIATATLALTPTPAAAPLPPPLPATWLELMHYEYQKLNNCGPVSLAIVASFFGYGVSQVEVAEVVKGGPADKNVSPAEMVAYLHTLGLEAVYRVNGHPTLLHQLLSNQIPVIVQQWLIRPYDGQLVGHYRVVRGYDAGRGHFFVSDPFVGPQLTITADDFETWWRPFNRGYIPVYRPEQRPLVAAILGEDGSAEANLRRALVQAQAEVETRADGYAFFNLGEAYLALGEPAAALQAYEQALTFDFPQHFWWYQFGHLEALNQTGAYQRVLELSAGVLAQAGELEEVRLQRSLAYLGLDDPTAARMELEQALVANPRYTRAMIALEGLEKAAGQP